MKPVARTVVLNVDDQDPQRYVKARDLQRGGFAVVDAQSGAQALQLVELHHPAVVLLDVQLPDRTGFEVASLLTGNGAAVNVVLVSSRDCCDYGTLVEESGASGFVPKGELSGARIAALLR